MRSLILLFALLGTVQGAIAQSASRSDPADPGTAVPDIQPISVFKDYRPFREQTSNSWKQMNDEVAANPGMGDMSSMKGMSGRNMSEGGDQSSSPSKNHDEHGGNVMTSPRPGSDQISDSRIGSITGTGVVRSIDKGNSKVQLTHDPIDALGWPAMTMFFRLKDNALANQINVGDRVDFFLEKSGSGYVISGFGKLNPGTHKKQMK